MAEFLLHIEPEEQAAPLTVNHIEQAARARGFVPRHVARTDRGWWVQVGTNGGAPGAALELPEGWQVVDERPVLERMSWPAASRSPAVGDVFTFALLLWPAVVGLFVMSDEGWQLALKTALAVWLGVMHLVAYRQERGAFFGNSMLMLSGCVAGFWWTHPGPWMYVWLFVILVGVYAAVRGTLQGRARSAEGVAQTMPSGGSG
jgi:hypothetical protein